MRWRSASVLLMALAVAACEPPARPLAPYFVIPPGPAAPAKSEAPAEDRLAVRPLLNQSNPDVQYFLPSHPGDVERGPAPGPGCGTGAGPRSTSPGWLGRKYCTSGLLGLSSGRAARRSSAGASLLAGVVGPGGMAR